MFQMHHLRRSSARAFTLLGIAVLLCLATTSLPPADAHAQTPPATVQVAVTTTADRVDGAVSSLTALRNNPGVDGAVSLREALLATNATTSELDVVITFNIPASDASYDGSTWTIILDPDKGTLPSLTHGQVTIDGGTQIVLDGGNEYAIGSGLTITSPYNVVRGLTLQHFYDVGILILDQDAHHNQIVNCVLQENGDDGVLVSGDAAYTSIEGTLLLHNDGAGIELRDGPTHTQIGGTTPAARNIIAGNGFSGVLIAGAASQDNTVAGNWIGVDTDGKTALPNKYNGVRLTGTSHVTIGGTQAGAGNIISGNDSGISVENTSYSTIAGNIIGLAPDGMTTLSNIDSGIFVRDGSNHNLIGGTTSAARNIIAGNGAASSPYGQGIYITDPGTTNNLIQGNFVGMVTDGQGNSLPRPNRNYGIQISIKASDNVIGGSTAGAGNVIAANYGGVRIDLSSNQVAGNWIGVGADGSMPLPNQYNGVRIEGNDNTVGPGNVIANHPLSGIMLNGLHTQIISNTVEANQRSGICVAGADALVSGNVVRNNGSGTGPWAECDLRGGIVIDKGNATLVQTNMVLSNQEAGIAVQGGTRNQLLANSISNNAEAGIMLVNGGNNEIAPPQIQQVTTTGMQGISCPNCHVEIYSDAANEGKYFIRATTAQLDGSFTISFTPEELQGSYLTATLTDADGNTSSFTAPVRPIPAWRGTPAS